MFLMSGQYSLGIALPLGTKVVLEIVGVGDGVGDAVGVGVGVGEGAGFGTGAFDAVGDGVGDGVVVGAETLTPAPQINFLPDFWQVYLKLFNI